jgi:hypothetical protein
VWTYWVAAFFQGLQICPSGLGVIPQLGKEEARERERGASHAPDLSLFVGSEPRHYWLHLERRQGGRGGHGRQAFPLQTLWYAAHLGDRIDSAILAPPLEACVWKTIC